MILAVRCHSSCPEVARLTLTLAHYTTGSLQRLGLHASHLLSGACRHLSWLFLPSSCFCYKVVRIIDDLTHKGQAKLQISPDLGG
jgi:hypothetical protein